MTRLATKATPTVRKRTKPKKEDEHVTLSGPLPDNLNQIRASKVSLMTVFGEDEAGRDIIVPLVNWQLFGQSYDSEVKIGENQYGPELSSQALMLDNLAFLLQDISFDTREAVRVLAAQSKGGLSPLEGRMRYTARMLRRASVHISAAAEQIETDLLGVEQALLGKSV